MLNWDTYTEAYNRGILPPEKKAVYEEAMRRGIIPKPVVTENVQEKSNLPKPPPSMMNRMGSAEIIPQIVTGIIAQPIAGVAGLASLPFTGLKGAADTIEKVQSTLTYEPKTEFGKLSSDIVQVPSKVLSSGAGYVGGKLEEAGSPMLGATAHSAIESLPILVPGAKAIKTSMFPPPISVAKSNQMLSSIVRDGMQKGIRPTVSGKASITQINKWYENATNAVKSIVRRSDEIPKSTEDFSSKIKEVKVQVWNEASELTKQAGRRGIQIDLEPIIADMEEVASNANLRRTSPGESSRLMALADEWRKLPRLINPSEAEELLAYANNNAKSWWNNPNPNDIRAALSWERTASKIRTQLESSIPNGEKYMALRDEYKSLSAIEKDVTHRSIVYGRQNPRGFFDIANIAAAAEYARALANLDPGSMAAAAAIKGAVKYTKWVNSPDTIINKMFSKAKDVLDRTELPKESMSVTPELLPSPAIQMGGPPYQGQLSLPPPPTLRTVRGLIREPPIITPYEEGMSRPLSGLRPQRNIELGKLIESEKIRKPLKYRLGEGYESYLGR